MTPRPLTIGTWLLLAAAIVSAAAGLLSYDSLRPLGSLIRRAEDLTPERHAHFRHVCCFFAVGFAISAAGILHRRSAVEDFIRGLRPASSARDPSPSARRWLLPVLIVLVAAALRLLRINDSLAYDEAYTYVNFASRPWYLAIGDYNSTNNHLLNTLLMLVSTRLFGPQEWALRWHVFAAGSLLPLAVWWWSRTWKRAAESDSLKLEYAAPIAAALAAVSPMLITYSTDARGYILVALAAVLLDGALARIRQNPSPRQWFAAWFALVLGLCSMPLMVYAAAGSLGWFLLLPGAADESPRAQTIGNRIRSLVPFLGTAALAVALFYTPAYIFRGLMFLRDPIVVADAGGNFAAQLAGAWRKAFDWWINGVIPNWLWVIAALLGALAIGRDVRFWLRWSVPCGVVLLLNIAQHVAPPPRIYFHLAPWLFLLAAIGVVALLSRLRVTPGVACGLNRRSELCDAQHPFSPGPSGRAFGALPKPVHIASALVLVTGAAYAVSHPVLFHAQERTSFVSVREVIDRLQQEVAAAPQAQHVLIAPLPCDLPAIFYMDRAGFRIPLNAPPPPGAHVWLIARHNETPAEVHSTPLVDMTDHIDKFDAWETIETFDTLNLYHATAALD